MSYVVTKTKAINGKYHRFLGRHFPRFYVLYTIFMKGKNETTQKFLNQLLGRVKELAWIRSFAGSAMGMWAEISYIS